MNVQIETSAVKAVGKPLFESSKRLFDIVASVFLLIILSPVFAITAICIKRMSKGPVYFRQVRVGKDGREFLIFKFRTMICDPAPTGPQITSSDDQRITTIGKKLRNFKIDELPQLLNVFRGEMSLVGPRPQVPRFVDHFGNLTQSILSVRPGMTGMAQLVFRNEEEMLEGRENREEFYIRSLLPIKCRIDFDYVMRRGVVLDSCVLVRTAWLIIWCASKKVLGLTEEPDAIPTLAIRAKPTTS